MSASDEWVFSLLMSLGRMLPMFIVWFIGLVIALVRWPRCPAVSMLVVAAIVLVAVIGAVLALSGGGGDAGRAHPVIAQPAGVLPRLHSGRPVHRLSFQGVERLRVAIGVSAVRLGTCRNVNTGWCSAYGLGMLTRSLGSP